MKTVAHERYEVALVTCKTDGGMGREFRKTRNRRGVILLDANHYPPGTIIEVRLPEKGEEKA